MDLSPAREELGLLIVLAWIAALMYLGRSKGRTHQRTRKAAELSEAIMRTATMNHDEQHTTLEVLSFIFGVSSLAGLTRLLKSGRPLNARLIIATTLSTGIYSLAMALVLYDYFASQRMLMVGMCLLSGIGTQTSAEFLWNVVKNVIEATAKAKGSR